MTTNLHSEQIARLLTVAAATSALPSDAMSDAAETIQFVDAGPTRSKATAAVTAQQPAPQERAAHEAAQTAGSRAVKAALEQLRGVAEPERKVGLAPADPATVVVAVLVPMPEVTLDRSTP